MVITSFKLCRLVSLMHYCIFMDRTNRIFGECLDSFITIFIEDIIIYSKSKEEQQKHLRLPFQVLRQDQLYAKLSKCEFWHRSVTFLGHVVSDKGVEVDPGWLRLLRTGRNLSFPHISIASWDLAGFYSRFVKGFFPLFPHSKLWRRSKSSLNGQRIGKRVSRSIRKASLQPRAYIA